MKREGRLAHKTTKMIEVISQPWPWYVSGIAISAVMFSLIFFGKTFGFSSNLRTMCTMLGAGKKLPFFDFDWRTQRWNLLFLLGAVLGGFLSDTWLQSDEPLQLSAATINDLSSIGISFDGGLNPGWLF